MEYLQHIQCVIHQSKLLIKAASIGDKDSVTASLKSHANIHHKGDKAVKIAAFHGHLEIVRILIAHDADPNADLDWQVSYQNEKDKKPFVRIRNFSDKIDIKESAVVMALKANHPDVVDFLIDHTNMDDIIKDHSLFNKHYDLLIEAVRRQNLDIKSVFECDNSKSIKDELKLIDTIKKHFDNWEDHISAKNLLRYYMYCGNCKNIQRLLTQDVSLAVNLAFDQPHLHVLKFVVQHFQVTLNHNHIHLAATNKNIEFLRFVLKSTKDFSFDNNRNQLKHFIKEVSKRPPTFLELLVANGFALATHIETLGSYACKQGNVAVAKYLVDHGLVLDDSSFYEADTPEMIDFLIGCGLDIHDVGSNIIIGHARRGSRKLVHKFLDEGVTNCELLSTICIWDCCKDLVMKAMKHSYDASEYNTVLVHYEYPDFHLTRRLLELGADVNYFDDYGRTPLSETIGFGGKIGIIEYLIAKGAKVDVYTLRVAARSGRLDVVELLLQKGIKSPKDIIIDAFAGGNIDIIMLFGIKNIHIKQNTVILEVAQHGHDELMHYLVERGDFVLSYRAALEVAEQYHRHAIQQMLIPRLIAH